MVTKKFYYICILLSLAAAPAPALGQAAAQTDAAPDFWSGGAWYLGAKGGANWLDDTFHLEKTHSHTFIAKGGFDDGVIGAIQGGYAFANGISFEVEGSFRNNNSDKHAGFGAWTPRGPVQQYAGMADVLYELPLDFALRPYIGAGVGASEYSAAHLLRGLASDPYWFAGNGWDFAYQAMGGVAYAIDDNAAVKVEYRWYDQPDDYARGLNAAESHSVLLGVSFKFGAPAPEPAPQPIYVPPTPVQPPPVAHSYLVFFDFDKSDLTPEAVKIVAAAAANAGPSKVTRIDVTGHTDTVGSDAYNMRLSRRRAESVAAQLQKDGIPASEIAIYAKGKRDLLIPTKDGVREPRNRRVQIVYGFGGES